MERRLLPLLRGFLRTSPDTTIPSPPFPFPSPCTCTCTYDPSPRRGHGRGGGSFVRKRFPLNFTYRVKSNGGD
jgi:hypothetical protein